MPYFSQRPEGLWGIRHFFGSINLRKVDTVQPIAIGVTSRFNTGHDLVCEPWEGFNFRSPHAERTHSWQVNAYISSNRRVFLKLAVWVITLGLMASPFPALSALLTTPEQLVQDLITGVGDAESPLTQTAY